MADRVVLAYSGGLDTSVAISWIGKETGAEVVAVAIDLGGQGGEDMEVVRQRAIDCGAVESVVVDARDEFADEYCLPTIAANALYMDRYPLVSAISRPLIVKHIVEAARSHGGTIVSHGCTGKGNDQVRFEVGFGALAPDLQVIAPVRDYAWTREKAIAFAEENNIPINVSKKSPFSIDQNVWGRAVETGFLEDLWNAPTKDVYDYTQDPTVNWNAPDELIISFDKGRPVAIDGRPVSVLEAIQELNKRAALRASAVSTSSRTVSWASRAVRSTKLPARWFSSPHTRNSSTSPSNANSVATSVRWSSVGPSWSTTASGSRPSRTHWTRSSTRRRNALPATSVSSCTVEPSPSTVVAARSRSTTSTSRRTTRATASTSPHRRASSRSTVCRRRSPRSAIWDSEP